MKTVLAVTNVSKIFKMDGLTFPALKRVSFTIKDGEFVAIMGPSGSGKSTLMYIIGCLDKPSDGKVTVDGVDVTKATETQLAKIRNQKIGFVFQQYNLLGRTSALANVELPLIYSAMETSQRKQQAKAMLEQVGLKDKLNNFPSQLSGGQQQRVAIARAIVTNPTIILADEPTGNLDTVSGKTIMELFDKFNRQGKTIILVTHEESVAKHASRKITIVDGVVKETNSMSFRT